MRILKKEYRTKGSEVSSTEDFSSNDIIDLTDIEGFTPLDVAIMNNNVRAAAELIEGGADVNVSSDKGDYPNHRPLHLACTKGNRAVTKLLLMQKEKADIHLTAGKSNTLLHKAVYNGNAGFIRMLVEAIKEHYLESDLEKLLDSKSLDDKTPLMCAVEDNNADIVEVLIDSRPIADQSFLWELFTACMMGLLDMVKLLISKQGL